ncbi:MAG: hypothetical protein ABW216_04705 [Candidatus Rokuibacteriota bacterium]
MLGSLGVSVGVASQASVAVSRPATTSEPTGMSVSNHGTGASSTVSITGRSNTGVRFVASSS